MSNFLHFCLSSLAVKVGIIIALASKSHVGIYSYGHLFNYLLGSYNVPSSVLSTEDIVESKTQTPFLYLWSMVRVGWRVSLYSISCKINQDNQTVHDALEGDLGGYQVRRGENG